MRPRIVLPRCGGRRVKTLAPGRAKVSSPRQVAQQFRYQSSTSTAEPPKTATQAYVPRQDGLEPHAGHTSEATHELKSLGPALSGEKVVVGGWLFSQRRASANLHFFTLRDSTGSCQLVSKDEAISKRLMEMPLESVVMVEGIVREKKGKAVASSSSSAQGPESVEVELEKVTLLNPAEDLPFHVSRQELANEEIRAENRFLDLRRPELASNLKMRSKVAHLVRCYLHDLGFDEIDTPILLNSSPEGAREYLVPTRLSKSPSTSQNPLFYALQQSPQQPKQLLMASGATSKYFQIARCFRDEDGRKDRQPEFTQIDLEMAFVSGAGDKNDMMDTWGMGGREVKEVIEGLMRRIWKEVKDIELGDFRCMPYQVAMDVYGLDKPDVRFEMYTLPLGYYPACSDSDLDKLLLDQSQYTVEWMITRKDQAKHLDIDKLRNDYIQPIQITEANMNTWHNESPFIQPMNLSLNGEGAVTGGAVQPGDIIWLAQRKKIPEGGWTQLGRLRVQIMEELVSKGAMRISSDPHFLWITQFPLFTQADEDKAFLSKGRWASSHHPFTAPMYEDLEDLKKGQVEKVRGQHYDLVLNGQEIGGGSVRIHNPRLQEHIMRNVLQLNEEEVGRFSHLLKALKSGAPPHGGIALGFDRLMAILCDAKSIREVLAFPKSQSGSDPVFKSPSTVSDEILKGYGLTSANKA